jgi:hypothetical protein
VEPFFSPTSWQPRRKGSGANLVDNENITIVRMSDSVRENNVVKCTFHYLIGTASGVEHFTELHEFALFTDDEIRDAFSAAGMDVSYDATGLMGRGLYMGTWTRERPEATSRPLRSSRQPFGPSPASAKPVFRF